VGGLRVETHFAPQDRVGATIAARVSQAQRSIRFLAFSFTHDAIGEAMIARKNAGVQVQGVFETTGSSTRASEFGRMKEAGLDVYQDGSPYAMHHKVILLDDSVAIFGSFNFSANADEDNDENLLVVEGPEFAARFDEEFQRILALAKAK
jgi:phosphatidylserine/phosphatidylglycerophosphate/cardiolipin synthase-like enzyme